MIIWHNRSCLVKASIFFSFLSQRSLSMGLMAFCMFFVACGTQIDIPVVEPGQKTATKSTAAGYETGAGPFPDGKSGRVPIYPNAIHLKDCTTDDALCTGGTSCLGLGGVTKACFFKCNPKEGEGEVQNPNCLAPENCIALSGGTDGVCIFFPGQLFGNGSYKGLIRHKPQARCLLRYGGCQERYICVDTKNDGSIGTCEEACQPATHAGSKNQPVCTTPNTKCKALASGIGACLP